MIMTEAVVVEVAEVVAAEAVVAEAVVAEAVVAEAVAVAAAEVAGATAPRETIRKKGPNRTITSMWNAGGAAGSVTCFATAPRWKKLMKRARVGGQPMSPPTSSTRSETRPPSGMKCSLTIRPAFQSSTLAC